MQLQLKDVQLQQMAEETRMDARRQRGGAADDAGDGGGAAAAAATPK